MLPVARYLEIKKKENIISLQYLILLPGNEIQCKWKNIRDNFWKELQLQKAKEGDIRARDKKRAQVY